MRSLHVLYCKVPKRVRSMVILGRPKKVQLRAVPSIYLAARLRRMLSDIERPLALRVRVSLPTWRPLSFHLVLFPGAGRTCSRTSRVVSSYFMRPESEDVGRLGSGVGGVVQKVRLASFPQKGLVELQTPPGISDVDRVGGRRKVDRVRCYIGFCTPKRTKIDSKKKKGCYHKFGLS